MKKLAIVASCVVILMCLTGCASEKVWYEDEYFAISGFSIEEMSGGIYSAKGTVKAKNGACSKGMMASVILRDKDGNQVAEAVGMANDIPKDGSAEFLVPFFDGSDFMSKEQVDSVISYEISDIDTAEKLDYMVDELTRKADEAEEELKRKYPNEDL